MTKTVTTLLTLTLLGVSLVLVEPGTSAVAGPARATDAPPLVSSLLDGSAEQGTYAASGAPTSWQRSEDDVATLTWARSTAHGGRRSLAIASTELADASWTQTVTVTPGQLYRFTGWIKTKGVTKAVEQEQAGANLSVVGTFTHSAALTGTHGWTYRSVTVAGPADGRLTLGARLGYWAGRSTGLAWFDDLQLAPVLPVAHPNPSWKVLALVYDRSTLRTDASDGSTTTYVARLSRSKKRAVDADVRRFVGTDIPALTSGRMVPRLTIRHRPEAPLEPYEDGWWPSEQGSLPDRSGSFDAVIVVYPNKAVARTTGALRDLAGSYDGLTPGVGTEQTFSMLSSEAVTDRGHLNVLKHEFGHSLTSFYEAAGTAPKPMVDIHRSDLYVNCLTGLPDVVEDETDAHPIPNSTYNNGSGFTHDYYSGTAALASDPHTCLGITPGAWAAGGPRSVVGLRTEVAHARVLRDDVAALVQDRRLSATRGRVLTRDLDALVVALTNDRTKASGVAVQRFLDDVRRYERGHRLPRRDAHELRDDAELVRDAVRAAG